MVKNYVQDRVSGRIKEIIGIEEFDNTKTLVNIDDKLPDDITFKYAALLVACVIKDDGKFYPPLFLEKALYDE